MKKLKRQYQNQYPSVTQVLDVLRKPGLEMWFKMNTLQYINEKSSKGKLVGTQIHEAIETFINTGKTSIETDYVEEVVNALKSFMLFRKEHPEIKLKLTETALTSMQYGYNGTIDAPHPPELTDWKTAECRDKDKPEIYKEYKYQTSAYVYLWNENNPNELINKVNIVSLAKDKVAYNLDTMDIEEINDCFNEVFLSALKISKYNKERHFYGKPVAVNC